MFKSWMECAAAFVAFLGILIWTCRFHLFTRASYDRALRLSKVLGLSDEERIELALVYGEIDDFEYRRQMARLSDLRGEHIKDV